MVEKRTLVFHQTKSVEVGKAEQRKRTLAVRTTKLTESLLESFSFPRCTRPALYTVSYGHEWSRASYCPTCS